MILVKIFTKNPLIALFDVYLNFLTSCLSLFYEMHFLMLIKN